MKLALIAGVAVLGFSSPVFAQPAEEPSLLDRVREIIGRVTESKEMTAPTYEADDMAERAKVLVEEEPDDDLGCRILYVLDWRNPSCEG